MGKSDVSLLCSNRICRMMEDLPNLVSFSRMYWNQMGSPLYSSIEEAFLDMITDSRRLPDGGREFKESVRRELLVAANDPKYEEWVNCNRGNMKTAKSIGGRFITRDDAISMLE